MILRDINIFWLEKSLQCSIQFLRTGNDVTPKGSPACSQKPTERFKFVLAPVHSSACSIWRWVRGAWGLAPWGELFKRQCVGLAMSGLPQTHAQVPCMHTKSLQSCQTLCKPMDCISSVQFSRSVVSNSLWPHESQHARPPWVHYQLPEFTQTHAHRVSDAIQPSHPLSSPSPTAPNPSQHQSLFQWVNSSHEVAKVLKFQL